MQNIADYMKPAIKNLNNFLSNLFENKEFKNFLGEIYKFSVASKYLLENEEYYKEQGIRLEISSKEGMNDLLERINLREEIPRLEGSYLFAKGHNPLNISGSKAALFQIMQDVCKYGPMDYEETAFMLYPTAETNIDAKNSLKKIIFDLNKATREEYGYERLFRVRNKEILVNTKKLPTGN